jgi:hypothetical protein
MLHFHFSLFSAVGSLSFSSDEMRIMDDFLFIRRLSLDARDDGGAFSFSSDSNRTVDDFLESPKLSVDDLFEREGAGVPDLEGAFSLSSLPIRIMEDFRDRLKLILDDRLLAVGISRSSSPLIRMTDEMDGFLPMVMLSLEDFLLRVGTTSELAFVRSPKAQPKSRASLDFFFTNTGAGS